MKQQLILSKIGSPRNSYAAACVAHGRLYEGELFRSESNIHDEASDTIQHVRRHLTDAEISVLDHQVRMYTLPSNL